MPPKNWHHQGGRHGNNMHQQNEGSSSNQQQQPMNGRGPHQHQNGQRYTDMGGSYHRQNNQRIDFISFE